ncbi:MAG TPA: pyridoxamine 5'-phosphate oxidase family protein [Acidimicrobiales bacterium]|nr:pyridoxamine 5'-phosphate oxidase family protein [Acidimicrobiales bacterium]
MTEDGQPALEEMSVDECLEVLSRHAVGRLGVVIDGKPMIYPVNYVLDGDSVVFRNDPGAKLTNATLDPVAFEVDEIDESGRSGVSVVAQGVGVEFTEAVDEASLRARRLDLRPWTAGEKGHWVRITRAIITGRRLPPSA